MMMSGITSLADFVHLQLYDQFQEILEHFPSEVEANNESKHSAFLLSKILFINLLIYLHFFWQMLHLDAHLLCKKMQT
jgi:hypothetical protein